MLGIASPQNTVEHKRLLRIVVAQMHEDPVAFHVIQKESQLGIVVFVGALFLHREATLIVHGKARQRIPDDDGLVIDDFRAPTSTQKEIMRPVGFVARKANAHLGMLDIAIFRIIAFKEFEFQCRRATPLGI